MLKFQSISDLAVRCLAVLATIIVVAGCASTATVQSAKSLAGIGKQYATTMDALAATALDRRLDRGVRDLNAIRDAGPATDKLLGDALAKRTENARVFATQIGLYRAQLQALSAYFDALDSLASADVKAPIQEAVQSTAGQLDALGKALKATGLSLTADQQQAVGALAGLVAEQVHAQAVAAALRRDAPIIGTQLALQKDALALFLEVLGTESDSRLAELEMKEVRAPYIANAGADKKPPLPIGWADAWKEVVRERALAQQAQSAVALTAAMETAWADYLQGKVDTTALLADLQRLQAAVDALGKLHGSTASATK